MTKLLSTPDALNMEDSLARFPLTEGGKRWLFQTGLEYLDRDIRLCSRGVRVSMLAQARR